MDAPAPRPPPATEKKLAVRCSRVAGAYMQEMRDRAKSDPDVEKHGSRWETAYSGLRTCLDEIIPRFALDVRFALAQHGDVRLAGIYRHHVGRLVVFWIASSALQRAIVLLVGYRKEGDANDAYRVLERYLRAGEFDTYFAVSKGVDMKPEFDSYLRSVGLVTPLLARAAFVLEFYEERVGIAVQDIFVSENKTDAKQREYGSLWVFGNGWMMEAKNFATGYNLDACHCPNIAYWEWKVQEFDFVRAQPSSEAILYVQLGTTITGSLRATGDNCLQLWKVFRGYVVPSGCEGVGQ